MKLAIVGNKSIEKYDISYKSFCDQLEFIFHNDDLKPDTIVSDVTKGIGSSAKQFAEDNGLKNF